jgi:hypothetical protein
MVQNVHPHFVSIISFNTRPFSTDFIFKRSAMQK